MAGRPRGLAVGAWLGAVAWGSGACKLSSGVGEEEAAEVRTWDEVVEPNGRTAMVAGSGDAGGRW
jgi:hypothetical protein